MSELKLKPKDVIYYHACGCITCKYEDGISFKKICNKHMINNKMYIALCHPMEKGLN